MENKYWAIPCEKRRKDTKEVISLKEVTRYKSSISRRPYDMEAFVEQTWSATSAASTVTSAAYQLLQVPHHSHSAMDLDHHSCPGNNLFILSSINFLHFYHTIFLCAVALFWFVLGATASHFLLLGFQFTTLCHPEFSTWTHASWAYFRHILDP